MREVLINQEPVELFKLVKFAGFANSGGESKKMIEDQLVRVNGDIETRKRRKIMARDVIAIADDQGEEGDEFVTVLVASAE